MGRMPQFFRFTTLMVVHHVFDLVGPCKVHICVNLVRDDVYHGVAHLEGTSWHFEVRLSYGFIDLLRDGEQLDLCGYLHSTADRLVRVPQLMGFVKGYTPDQGLVVVDVDDLLQYV